MKIKHAFTLAELLITVTIIGVVAALTLPVLTSKIGDIVIQNQRKKAQSVIANGVKMLVAQDSTASLANTSLKRCRANSSCIANEVSKAFKVLEDNRSQNDLFAMIYTFDGQSQANSLDLTNLKKSKLEAKDFKEEKVFAELKVETKPISSDFAVWQDGAMNYVFTTSDGMIFGIMNNEKSRDTLTILADVNGAEMPNAGGTDLCTYIVNSGGAIAESCSSSFIPTIKDDYANEKVEYMDEKMNLEIKR